jgi:formylmethanofuran dehydrogenase subunit C
MAGLSLDEIRALPVNLGKRQRRLDDFFTVEGERSDDIEVHGDATRVKWIGRGMTRGRIVVRGTRDAPRLGDEGRRIEVFGNASDWLGAEMTAALIHGPRQRRRASRRRLPRKPERHEGRDHSSSTARRGSKSACG